MNVIHSESKINIVHIVIRWADLHYLTETRH